MAPTQRISLEFGLIQRRSRGTTVGSKEIPQLSGHGSSGTNGSLGQVFLVTIAIAPTGSPTTIGVGVVLDPLVIGSLLIGVRDGAFTEVTLSDVENLLEILGLEEPVLGGGVVGAILAGDLLELGEHSTDVVFIRPGEGEDEVMGPVGD